jgi:DNA-binding transcriptional regulator YhcF (GntR family)
MSDQGWIKLHRKLLNNPLANHSAHLSLWITLLLLANHKEHKFMWNKKFIIIKEGQLITGRKELAKQTNIPGSTIERILELLENEHQIEQQKTTKFRLITILNWEQYQKDGQQNGQQTDNKRTTDGHIQECNNVKNEKNTISKPDGLQDEVNQIMDIFYKINPSLNYGNRTQREAVNWGLKKWGLNEMLRMVEYAVSIQGRDYAPVITTPLEFKNKIAKVKIFKDQKDKPALTIIG